jgi:hypothetical protein
VRGAPRGCRRHLLLLPLRADEKDPLEPFSNATPPPSSFFFLWLSLSLSPVETLTETELAVAAAAARRLPLPLRLAVDLRLAVLFLLDEAIEPEPLETPPPSPFLSAEPSAAVVDSAAAGHPPVPSTSPATSW